MDKNLHNDNLEQFFKKILSAEDPILPDNSGWDEPSNAVWEGIANRLPTPVTSPPPSARILKYWWVVAASILVVWFGYMAYQWQHKINSLEEQLIIQSDQLKKLQEEADKKMAPPYMQAQEEDYTPASDNAKPPQQEELVTRSGTNSTQSTQRQTHNPQQGSITPNDNQVVVAETSRTIADENGGTPVQPTHRETSPDDLNRSPVPLHPKDQDESKQIVKTPPADLPQQSVGEPIEDVASTILMPVSVLSLNTHKSLLLYPEKPVAKGQYELIEPVHLSKNKQWYVGAYYAPASYNGIIRTKEGVVVTPKGKKNNQSSFETGIKVGWQFHDNWSLESGLTKAKNTVNRRHKVNLHYDPSNEAPNTDGNLEGTYTTELRTDYGDVPINIDLSRRPDQVFNPGSSFMMTLESEVTTTFVQVPLAVRYRIGRGPFGVSVSAGGKIALIQDQQHVFPMKPVVSGNPLRHERSRVRDTKSKLNDVHYALQTGIQLSYRPVKNLEFYLAPHYTRGVSPILDDNKVFVYLAQTNVQAGMNIRF